MKKILLLIVCLQIPIVFLAQGPISRPSKQETNQYSRQKKNDNSMSVSKPDGYIDGHGYVDLRLPSGTKWATCNIGASNISDYGDYYAWGELTPKSIYTEDNSLIGDKNLGSIAGNPKYDAASYNWGSNWQMPSKGNFDELKSYCKWSVIIYNGICGHKAMGPNGKSLFFPCGGEKEGSHSPYLSEGSYLTSEHDEYGPIWFNLFGRHPGIRGFGDIDYYAGRSIRAIEKQ